MPAGFHAGIDRGDRGPHGGHGAGMALGERVVRRDKYPGTELGVEFLQKLWIYAASQSKAHDSLSVAAAVSEFRGKTLVEVLVDNEGSGGGPERAHAA